MSKESEKSEKYLKNLSDFSNKTDYLSKQLLMQLKDINYKTMNEFTPYVNAKKNISSLLVFYDVYTNAIKDSEKIQQKIEDSELFEDIDLNLQKLSKIKIIGLIGHLSIIEDSLNEYSEVKIVIEFKEKIRKFIKSIIVIIKRVFFSALTRLPKIVHEMDVYAKFLLREVDNKEFLGEYTKQVYKSLGFFEINNNFEALLQQTTNLTKYFNLIINMNIEIIGRRAAQNINIGLISLILINLKKVIAGTLSIIDADNKARHVSFLIQLYGNLRHSEGPMIGEIEDLFVFKEPIKKLILNCLIQFFVDLERLEEANAGFLVEEINLQMVEILDSFKANRGVRMDWADHYGPSFGVYNAKELERNFGEKCLVKVNELAEELKGNSKYVYLINNYHAFRGHLISFENQELKALVDKQCQIIVGLWRINIESKKGEELSRFLVKELKANQEYFLPEEQRMNIIEQLNKIIENLMSSKLLYQFSKEMGDLLKSVYSGV